MLSYLPFVLEELLAGWLDVPGHRDCFVFIFAQPHTRRGIAFCGEKPLTLTRPAMPLTWTLSFPLVALTTTRSAAASPVVPPSEPARSMLSSLTPVPVAANPPLA
jgi:hypothetical protein